MTKLQILLVSATVVGMSAAHSDAQTDSPTATYGSLGYTEDFRDGADLGSITARFGTKFNYHLGAEGELDVGTNTDRTKNVSDALSERLNAAVAAYGVGYLPLGNRVELLARVGVGETRFSSTLNGVSGHSDLTSLNYGLGAAYNVNPQNAFRVDFTRKDYNRGGGDDNVLTASLLHRF